MNQPAPSKFWLDQAADSIMDRYPEGEIVVSSGHSPSGTYHIGLTREMAICNAIVWALRQRKRQATHVDFVDDFDILRKLPADLPESLSGELGKPLCLAKGPDSAMSYGDYFYRQLAESMKQADLAADTTYFAATTYLKEHRYTKAIGLSLAKLDTARAIIEEVSHRKLPPDWGPVQLLSDDDRLNTWHYTGHDLERKVVTYRSNDGAEGELSFAEGRVKLDWRLDWPARWWIWSVDVEPFGRDHATKGGSYDTGKALVEELFGGKAPTPVAYDFINPVGGTKKFSKSAGGVTTPADALKVMPSEILRYFVVRSRPERALVFDPGLGLLNLIDEFAAVQADPKHEFRDAYDFAVDGKTKQVISSVSFKHLVQVYQAAQGDPEQTLAILARTGYAEQVKAERSVIVAELTFVKNWLSNYAPDDIKFSVQTKLPKAEFSDAQRSFLDKLAESIAAHKGELDGDAMHQLIYAAKDAVDLPPQDAFKALYEVVLGKDYGPKAGWFLASLDRDWLLQRLRPTS